MKLDAYLVRYRTEGLSVFGRMHVVMSYDNGRIVPNHSFTFNTLENKDKLVVCGTYPLKITYSPRFNKNLILVDNVEGRSGIRIHPFNYAKESLGCITIGIPSTDFSMICNTKVHCDFLQNLVKLSKCSTLTISE